MFLFGSRVALACAAAVAFLSAGQPAEAAPVAPPEITVRRVSDTVAVFTVLGQITTVDANYWEMPMALMDPVVSDSVADLAGVLSLAGGAIDAAGVAAGSDSVFLHITQGTPGGDASGSLTVTLSDGIWAKSLPSGGSEVYLTEAQSLSTPGTGVRPIWGSYSIVSTPLPGAMVLLWAGLGGLGLVRLRRQPA